MKHNQGFSFTLSELPNQEILLVDSTHQPINLANATFFTKEYARYGSQHNIKRALIDVRGSDCQTSIFEKYQYSHSIAPEQGLSKDWKLAMIKDATNSCVDFLETAMYCAGYNFQLFTNEEEALNWLEGTSSIETTGRKETCNQTKSTNGFFLN